MSQYRIGIIGGSGLYHIEGFTQQKWVKVKTPFGPPSDSFSPADWRVARWCFCPGTGGVTGCCPANSTTAPTSGR